jgi:hypothetical protein
LHVPAQQQLFMLWNNCEIYIQHAIRKYSKELKLGAFVQKSKLMWMHRCSVFMNIFFSQGKYRDILEELTNCSINTCSENIAPLQLYVGIYFKYIGRSPLHYMDWTMQFIWTVRHCAPLLEKRRHIFPLIPPTFFVSVKRGWRPPPFFPSVNIIVSNLVKCALSCRNNFSPN